MFRFCLKKDFPHNLISDYHTHHPLVRETAHNVTTTLDTHLLDITPPTPFSPPPLSVRPPFLSINILNLLNRLSLFQWSIHLASMTSTLIYLVSFPRAKQGCNGWQTAGQTLDHNHLTTRGYRLLGLSPGLSACCLFYYFLTIRTSWLDTVQNSALPSECLKYKQLF